MKKRSKAQLAADELRKARTRLQYKAWARSVWWMTTRGYNKATIAKYLGISTTIVQKVKDMFPPQ
jgi:hypothetical protein